MKLRLVIISVLLLLCFANSSFAEDVKIGYVDTERIARDYTGFQEAQSAFERDIQAWQQQAKELETEIITLGQEYESQKLMLSEERRRERESEIQQKEQEYYTFAKQIEQSAYQRNIELMQPIIEDISKILEKIGSEENFTIIFDSVAGNVLYAKENIDLTDRVIKELNKAKENE